MRSRWSQALLGGAVASLVITMALGQSDPDWPQGYVPTAAEWNGLWASKQDLLGFTPVNRAGDTMTGELKLPASTTGSAMLKVPEGQAPSSPKNGDVWTTSVGMFAQIEGVTVGPFGGESGPVNCTQLPAFFGAVTSVAGTCQLFIATPIPCADLPAFTGGDVSSSAGSCILTVTNGVFTNRNQSFTKAQRATPVTLSLSSSSFTPNFDNGQNFTMTLVHATCPCTIANPSTTPVAGQTGLIEIIQSATGSDTVSWGSSYIAAGGTSTLTLSTSPNSRDYLSYYVDDSTHIVVSVGALNATH